MNKMRMSPKRDNLPYRTEGLGVFKEEGTTYLFHSSPKTSKYFQVDKSEDGEYLKPYSNKANIQTGESEYEKIAKLFDFRITKVNNNYFLIYKLTNSNTSYLCAAESKDLVNWKKIGNIATPGEVGVLVGDYKYDNRYILYMGEKSQVVASSPDLRSWQVLGKPISYWKESKNDRIKIMNIQVQDDGIFVVYYQYKVGRNGGYKLKATLFEKDNPLKVIWDVVYWQQKKSAKSSSKPIGVVLSENKLISYWQFDKEKIFTQVFPRIVGKIKGKKLTFAAPSIKKHRGNPILKPISHHPWESKAVFNPAAFFDEGEIHIVYRAIGDKDVSSLGYAKSKNGVDFQVRHDQPVYFPTKKFEGGHHLANADYEKMIRKSKYISGPGWGGCEDPRITKIDDKLYMTYVAFDGFNPQRVALTSININDFRDDKWNWKEPVLMSPPGEVHKNWVIFPEKINGKFAVLHSISPSIMIDYVDSLDFDDNSFLKSKFYCRTRKGRWDSRVRGVGPPPLKTKDGWLLFYHAMDDNDPGKYKVGVMLLDYHNPHKVLNRSKQPVIEPDQEYENNGFKSGVVYASGAVIKDDTLYLYYGASDTAVALATANQEKFLYNLKTSHATKLRTKPRQLLL